MEELHGGRAGEIFKEGNEVLRTASENTVNIQKFLNGLHKEYLVKCPKGFGIDENGIERLSYLEGNVSNYPLNPEIYNLDMIESAGKLLREFHDASEKVSERMDANINWMLENEKEYEIIIHGDYAPYNVVEDNGNAIGIIDFDTIYFGKKISDISYGIYRWATLFRENSPDRIGDLDIQCEKASRFCEGYGLEKENRKEIVEVIIKRLEKLIAFMRMKASEGEANFIENIQDGHDIGYEEDIKYLKLNEKIIMDRLLQ